MSRNATKRGSKTKPGTSDRDISRKVAALRSLAPNSIDESAIRELVGDVRLRTLADVAAVFATARNTIQTSWRQAGCPGESGNYPVAAILTWLLQRDQQRSESHRPTNGYVDDKTRQELSDIELESARLSLEIKRAKALEASGRSAPIEVMRSVLRGILNVCRDQIMSIPRMCRPMFPAKRAGEWSAEIERHCRHALTAVADTPIDDILERMQEGHVESD